MKIVLFLALQTASALRVMTVADHDRGVSLGNRSDHVNPTHYGSPLDNSTAHPPINCKLDEDGLIIDSFIFNPVTGKTVQTLLMWCSPNTTRSGASACPTDIPAGATTKGAKAMPFFHPTTASGSCYLSCSATSDCGGGAMCANQTQPDSGPMFMCQWPLE